jgi:hypothetical protein
MEVAIHREAVQTGRFVEASDYVAYHNMIGLKSGRSDHLCVEPIRVTLSKPKTSARGHDKQCEDNQSSSHFGLLFSKPTVSSTDQTCSAMPDRDARPWVEGKTSD